MCANILFLGCLVVAQAAGTAPTASDLVAELLIRPADSASTVVGEDLTLHRTLGAVEGTSGRLAATHAYWRLTQGLAEYRSHATLADWISRLDVRPEDDRVLRAALASAVAELRIAEMEVLATQHELAAAASMAATEPLPVPVDLPCTSVYQTYFEEVFSTRNPPPKARLIDRNLPIRHQVIQVRTSAVIASRDSLEPTLEAYQAGQAGLSEVLASIRRLGEKHRALVGAVCNYNHQIADYALPIAGPQTDLNRLVGMLIGADRNETGRTPPAADSSEAGEFSGVRQAVATEPLARPGLRGSRATAPAGTLPSLKGQTPTLVPPPPPGAERPAEQSAAGEESASSSSGGDAERVGIEPSELGRGEINQPAAGGPIEVIPTAPPEATSTGPDESAPLGVLPAPPSAVPSAPPSAVPSAPPSAVPPAPQSASDPEGPPAPKSVLVRKATGQSAPAAALYPALLEAKPAVRAKQLAIALHWNRALPEQVGSPIDLPTCLANVLGGNRRGAISAFWLAAQRAAEYQVLVEKRNFLEELEPVALQQRNEPGGAETMLRLRSARLSAYADVLAAHVELVESQFQLTQLVGQLQNSAWLLPATAPHAGPYQLLLDSQPRDLVDSWPVRRSAAVIPALALGLQDRAASVVQSDVTRASTTTAYLGGTRAIGDVLTAIDAQTEETLAFLGTLSTYNNAVADYIFLVVPADVSADELARSLVLLPKGQ